MRTTGIHTQMEDVRRPRTPMTTAARARGGEVSVSQQEQEDEVEEEWMHAASCTSPTYTGDFTANDFVRNEAGVEGGAFRCEDTTGSNPVFTNVSSVFIDNTAPSFPNSFATGFSNTS